MRVSGIAHTGFSVTDIGRSLEFYLSLGCEVLWQREISDEYFRSIVGIPGCVVRAAHLRVPGSTHVIELFEYTPRESARHIRPDAPGHAHLAFIVEDLHSAYRQLSERGVRFTSNPIEITAGPNKGGWGVYMMDPDEITLELFQPPTSSR